MEIDSDKLFRLQEALIELSAENIELKKSATGPWNYDEPPCGEYILALGDNNSPRYPEIIKFDPHYPKMKIFCWAYINMPEVTG